MVLSDAQWARLEPLIQACRPGGVRVVASANGGEPAMWFVPGRP